MAKRTMTLNLPDAEMQFVEDMARMKDMSKIGIIRHALRLYQAVDGRLTNGKRIQWLNADGTLEHEMVIVGCGWKGMD